MSVNNENTAVSTEIEAVPSADQSLAESIMSMQDGRIAIMSTIQAETFEQKANVIALMNNTVPVKEHLNKVIHLANVVVQPVTMVNESTGVVEDQPRITLIDAKGVSYHCTSKPVYRALSNIFGIMGKPSTWPAPLPITFSMGGSGTRQFLDLKVAPLGSK